MGKTIERRRELGTAECLLDRASPQRARPPGRWPPALRHSGDRLGLAGVLLVALEVLPGLVDEDVVEGRLTRSSDSDIDPRLVEGDDDRADLGGPVLELDHQDAVAGGQRPAETREHLSARAPCRRRRAELEVRLCRPRPSAHSGVPSATSRPPEMIPTRSASWSASSRYWVVRKTVVPSLVQLADLLPDRLAAHGVEAGGRLVEEQHLGLVDERRGQVEPAPHAARIGADATVGGRSSPTRSSSQSARRSPSARGSRGASPAAGSARARSSADRAPPPAARPRSCAAPRPGPVATS